MNRSENDILDDLKTMLEFYEALGIGGISLHLKPSAPSDTPLAGGSDKEALLLGLRNEIGECVRCKLSKNRNSIVFGEGNPRARIMFIGEGPGKEEDIQGRPLWVRQGCFLRNSSKKCR